MAKRPPGTPQTFIQRSRTKGAAEKAFYHNISGAGKAKTVRAFLGLTPDEQLKIRQLLIDGMERELRNGQGPTTETKL